MRAGVKHKKVLDTGQKALLDAIWSLKGGPRAVAQVLGAEAQTPINWRNRQGVPLMVCLEVAEKLDIPFWGLNYRKFLKVYGKKTPEWPSVVKSYGLSKGLVDMILSLKPPNLT